MNPVELWTFILPFTNFHLPLSPCIRIQEPADYHWNLPSSDIDLRTTAYAEQGLTTAVQHQGRFIV